MRAEERNLEIGSEEMRGEQRRKFAELFSFSDQCTILQQRFAKAIPNPMNKRQAVMALYLFRCSSHYCASVSLAEGGMTIESLSISRGLFETTFVMLAIAEDAVSPGELAQHDIASRVKHANALLNSKDYPNIASFEDQLKEFVEHSEGSTTLDMREFARRGKALAAYDGLYRHLSHHVSHPSLSAIDDYLSKDEHGNILPHFLPALNKTPAALLCACAGILLACFAGEKVGIKMSDVDGSVASAWSKFERLYEKNNPWA